MSAVRIVFVCHGNICRSPMAESIMSHLVAQRGLSERFVIASRATSMEEIGNPPHRGTVAKLRQEGIPLVPHRATRLTKADYEQYDFIIGMDGNNYRNIMRIIGEDREQKVHLMLDFTAAPQDIDDPWYTGDFDTTYVQIRAGCEALLDTLPQGRG